MQGYLQITLAANSIGSYSWCCSIQLYRLMKINGCPKDENCGFYDYEMVDGKGLKLIRKELLPKEFQP